MNDEFDIEAAGTRVEPDAIASELRALWRRAGNEQSGGVSRALLLNFAMHVPAGGDLGIASRTVARVAAAIPCRAFVLIESRDPASGPPLAAWISSHCVLAAGGKQVCCEQVSLRARAGATDALATQLLSLLVPDLPTVLFWPDGDIDSRLLERIGHETDRLVVDSITFPDAAAGIARLAAFTHGSDPIEQVDDIAWQALEPWRELTAAPFDGPPFAALLPTIRSARVVHSPTGAAQAWMYAGWLASRLHWRPRARTGDTFAFDAANGRTELQFEVQDHPDPSLVAVELRAHDGVRFCVRFDRDHPTLLAGCVEASPECPMPQHRERTRLDRDESLVRVLQRRGPNRAHATALATAATLCEMGS
jgi:glucose-6-phosphate dehydrogenase assembly protein OpcA